MLRHPAERSSAGTPAVAWPSDRNGPPRIMIGAHMSVAGGLDQAPVRGRAAGCEVAQIFTKNSNQWAAKPLDPGEIERFRLAQEETGVRVLMAHDSYLINLCAEGELMARSEAAIREELERCEALGIPFLVVHPGAHLSAGEDEGLARMAAALDRLHAATPGFRSKILLENTAGQGTCVGYRFEHLARLFELVREPERLGVCLDTCHAFAAGYDIRTPEGYRRMMDEFDRLVGLPRLQAFHLNDARKGLGSRVDRHEHIGRGEIGLEAFRALLGDPRVSDRPMVLETPKGEEGGVDLDVINLTTLRRLRGEPVPAPQPARAGAVRSRRAAAGKARAGHGPARRTAKAPAAKKAGPSAARAAPPAAGRTRAGKASVSKAAPGRAATRGSRRRGAPTRRGR